MIQFAELARNRIKLDIERVDSLKSSHASEAPGASAHRPRFLNHSIFDSLFTFRKKLLLVLTSRYARVSPEA